MQERGEPSEDVQGDAWGAGRISVGSARRPGGPQDFYACKMTGGGPRASAPITGRVGDCLNRPRWLPVETVAMWEGACRQDRRNHAVSRAAAIWRLTPEGIAQSTSTSRMRLSLFAAAPRTKSGGTRPNAATARTGNESGIASSDGTRSAPSAPGRPMWSTIVTAIPATTRAATS